MSLLTKFSDYDVAPKIHFVDIVPQLMTSIESKLTRFYPQQQFNWQVHCQDLNQLIIEKSEEQQLVVIAGVGGVLMAEFVTNIMQNNTRQRIDLLLCPVNDCHLLRQTLSKLGLSLKSEQIITENKRFYEVILVTNSLQSTFSSRDIRPISVIGDEMWHCECEIQQNINQDYLTKVLAHLQRTQLSATPTDRRDSDIIAQYQSLQSSFKDK